MILVTDTKFLKYFADIKLLSKMTLDAIKLRNPMFCDVFFHQFAAGRKSYKCATSPKEPIQYLDEVFMGIGKFCEVIIARRYELIKES